MEEAREEDLIRDWRMAKGKVASGERYREFVGEGIEEYERRIEELERFLEKEKGDNKWLTESWKRAMRGDDVTAERAEFDAWSKSCRALREIGNEMEKVRKKIGYCEREARDVDERQKVDREKLAEITEALEEKQKEKETKVEMEKDRVEKERKNEAIERIRALERRKIEDEKNGVLVMERAICVVEEIERMRVERSLEIYVQEEKNEDGDDEEKENNGVEKDFGNYETGENEKNDNDEDEEYFENYLKAEVEINESDEEYKVKAERDFRKYFGNFEKQEDEKNDDDDDEMDVAEKDADHEVRQNTSLDVKGVLEEIDEYIYIWKKEEDFKRLKM